MITQFQGETRRDAIVNHFGFDIEEEDSFFAFINKQGYNENVHDLTIIRLYQQWQLTQD